MECEFNVYNEATDLWLHFDEKTWVRTRAEAASFTDADLACDIAKRENPGGQNSILSVVRTKEVADPPRKSVDPKLENSAYGAWLRGEE